MSEATKRKYVTSEVLNEYILPKDDQRIVKIVTSKGNNLHTVVASDDCTFLVSMPQKYRKSVWIKRGDYVIIDPIVEGDRVKGEITAILYKDQIKYIQSQGLWPFENDDKSETSDDLPIPADMLPPSESEDSDCDVDIDVTSHKKIVNPNWQQHSHHDDSDDDEGVS